MGQNEEKHEKSSKHRTKRILLATILILMPVFRYGIFDPYHHITLTIDLSSSTYYTLWSSAFFLLALLWMDSLTDRAFKKKLILKERLDEKESKIEGYLEGLLALKEKILEETSGEEDASKIDETITELNRELEEIREIKRPLSSSLYSKKSEGLLSLMLSEPLDALNSREIRRALIITLTIVYFIILFNPNYGNTIEGFSLVYLTAIASYFGSRTAEAISERKWG